MKTSLLMITFLFLIFSNSLFAESDIIWTKSIGSMVRTVKFSPDGRYVYAAAQGRGPLKLDANTGEILMEYKGFKYSDYLFYNSIDVSPDGKTVVGGDFHKLYLYDSETGKLQDSLESNTMGYEYNRFNDALFTKDNKYVAACLDYAQSPENTSSKLIIWDRSTKKIIKEYLGNKILKIVQTENASSLAYMDRDNSDNSYFISLLEIGTWKELGVLTGHTSRITDLSFSPDGTLLASRDYNRIVKIWNIAKKELLMSFNPNDAGTYTYTYCIALLSNNLLVSNSGIWDNVMIRSRDIYTKNEIYSIKINIAAGDWSFYEHKVAVAHYINITLFKADRLSSVSFNIGKEKLYPNPANQNLTIPKSYFDENFLYFNITDINGKEVYRYDKTPNLNFNEDLLVDVSGFLKGAYIVQLFYTTNVQALKFIKE